MDLSRIGRGLMGNLRSHLALLLLVTFVLSGCVAAQPAGSAAVAPAAEAESAEANTPETTEEATTEEATEETQEGAEAETTEAGVDLASVKAYLVDQATALKATSATLKGHADAYYALAEAADFDFAALWENESEPMILNLKLQEDMIIAGFSTERIV